jgi:SOS response regulatory protein OraA/RecX
MRDVSSAALDRKLAAAGIDEGTRRKTLEDLIQAGLVDDARLAHLRAQRLADRGYGDAAIEARLAESGIGRDEREQAIAALEPEQARAQSLIASRQASDHRKLHALLARRGFASESIEAALPASDGLDDHDWRELP